MDRPRFSVDLDAVAHNVAEWRRFLAPRELWAVVKSDAYGLGAVRIARACVAAGARRLCIVDIREARELRAAGVDTPIVHIAATPAAGFNDALKLDVAVTIDEWRHAETLDALASRSGTRARAHVAVDTGTGWSGLQPPDIRSFAKRAAQLRHIEWEGVWTHIAGPESLVSQVASYREAVSVLRDGGLDFAYEHVASTGPAIIGAPGNAARIGIGLYGSTDEEPTLAVNLKTAIELKAAVVYLKRFEVATTLGYGGTAVARPGDLVATLRAGYADGLPRGLANRGTVQIDSEVCPIVGAVGMNFTMVSIPRHLDISVGDEALIVGESDGHHIDEVSSRAGVIPHELVTALANALGMHRDHR